MSQVRRIVPNLHADDPAASRAFYVDLLGLEVAMDRGWIATYAAADAPALQISVIAQDASAAPLHPDVSIEVDDVEPVHAAAQRLGYEIC